jgi:Tfp pilus assembly protein PilO
LHDLAATYHLTLKNSEYRTSQNSKAGVIRQLRISIKSEGNYTDLRNFLRKIPQEIPALAIEQLSMNRQKISDTKVETTVEFDLFYSPTELKHTETDDLPLAKKS